MKKKEYERPAMLVVELKQTGMLMTSGQVDATLYEDGEFNETDILLP